MGMDDLEDIDDEMQKGMDELHLLIVLFAGQEAKARDVVLFALQEYPKVGKALLAASPRTPRKDGREGYTVGSDEEAWLYREDFLPLWEKLGALTWLAELARKTR